MDRKAAFGLAAGLTLGVGFLFGFAANRPASEASTWFTAIAAGVGAVGLIAAFLAALFAYGPYRELVRRQQERPRMQVKLEVAPGHQLHDLPNYQVLGQEEDIDVTSRVFTVRIHVRNDGDGVLRWGILNVQVIDSCEIHPEDDEEKHHYLSESPGQSSDLIPGVSIGCKFTVAERDFPPGHDFHYHVRVSGPAPRAWPIAAVVDGYPAAKTTARGRVVTHFET